MLVESDIRLVKYWLDISKAEQAARLQARKDDPLKLLKTSDLDEVAQKKWKAYSEARDDMLTATSTDVAPWWCVRADHKKPARLNIMRHLLHQIAPDEIAQPVDKPDPKVVFRFEPEAVQDGRLAP